jgi:phosphatidyl-myo-inositol dimannoside synthase
VVPGRDAGALAERLVALLTDPATARAMGDKGRAWVERDWSWDVTAARLRSLLD